LVPGEGTSDGERSEGSGKEPTEGDDIPAGKLVILVPKKNRKEARVGLGTKEGRFFLGIPVREVSRNCPGKTGKRHSGRP